MAKKKKRSQAKRHKVPRKKSTGPTQQKSDSDLDVSKFFFSYAERETKGVERRIEAELNKYALLEFLTRHFGSLVYNAAQRLIDRKARTGESRIADEAIILSCSRLFNECLAGYGLLRQGLILPSIVLLRSAFETSTQAVLFMEDEAIAVEWFEGAWIRPKRVRENSPYAAANKELYDRLSKLSHPNFEARFYHTVPVTGRDVTALAYGGWYAPKLAAQLNAQFLFAQLGLLEAFYTVFSPDLEQHGLLWKEASLEKMRELGHDKVPIDWQTYLQVWRSALSDLSSELDGLAPDIEGLSEYFGEIVKSR